LKRKQWDLFSLKVLTRLAQADDLTIEVKVSAKLKEAQTLEQLNAARKELGIADQFRKERTEGSISDSRLRIACFGASRFGALSALLQEMSYSPTKTRSYRF